MPKNSTTNTTSSAIQLHLSDAMFNERIRRTTHEGIEYFSLIDIMAEFSDSKAAGQYWRDTKKRLEKDGFQLQDKILSLKLTAVDGRNRATDCTDGQTVLRIIQSVPSEKAEPIRDWMATLGYRALEEMRNPELAVTRRLQELARYEKAGYGNHPDVERLRIRHEGIEALKQLKATISAVCTESPRFYEVFDAENFGLFGHVTAQLKVILKTDNIRDVLSATQLSALQFAEVSLREVLQNKKLDNRQIVNNASRICKGVGDNLELIAEMQGLDRVTWKPLLKNGQS